MNDSGDHKGTEREREREGEGEREIEGEMYIRVESE